MTFTLGDYAIATDRMAIRYLLRYRVQHPETFAGLSFGDEMELSNRLISRAFRPRVAVELMQRMKRRGHERPIDGEPNCARLSVKRNIERTLGQVADAIKRASERLERVQP